MTDRRKTVLNWNHISEDLSDDDVKELKSYYHSYHKKSWVYKQAMKRFRKFKLIGNSASIIFASGGIASSIATSGISLVGITTVALLIQAWMKYQNLNLKIHNCQYAYQSYDHLLTQIKHAMRTGNFEKDSLTRSINSIDDFVIDNSPVVDRFFRKYNEKFTAE